MARTVGATIRFDPKASRPKNGIALIYDLEGFSRFFNQPDVQDYVPKFLNHVSGAISTVFYGGESYKEADEEKVTGPLPPPMHEKFLGDGALYIWTPPGTETDFDENFVATLCNRLWNLKTFFAKEVLPLAADDVPVFEVPQRIRFGLARGTIYELTKSGSAEKEYIGFCVNLASRLQHYCPQLGFIASARLGLSKTILDANDYEKVVATKIKGFPKEIVIVDKNEFKRLEPAVRDELFTKI